MAEYAGVLDGIARSLQAEGAISSLYRELPFDERVIRICAESGRNFPQNFDFSLPTDESERSPNEAVLRRIREGAPTTVSQVPASRP